MAFVSHSRAGCTSGLGLEEHEYRSAESLLFEYGWLHIIVTYLNAEGRFANETIDVRRRTTPDNHECHLLHTVGAVCF